LTLGGGSFPKAERQKAVAAVVHIFHGTQMPKKSDLPSAPGHLKPATADWWRAVVAEYELSPSDLHVLEAACTHWDRAVGARDILAKSEHGLLAKDRFDQWKEHPAIAIEQNSTRLFLAALRQLGLDMEPSSEPYRLPNPTGRAMRED
jgi:P27 family predicted phage terminase small subunit